MNYPMHTPPKAKKPNVLLIVVLVLFTVTAACICGVAVATSSSEKKPSAPATTAAAACEHGTLPNGTCASAGSAGPQATTITNTLRAEVSPTPAKPAVPTMEEGLYTVGEDIPAGTYKTTGSPSTCYWAIYKAGQNQSFDSIVTNHLGGGNQRVTLKAGQEFESKRCGTWTKV